MGSVAIGAYGLGRMECFLRMRFGVALAALKGELGRPLGVGIVTRDAIAFVRDCRMGRRDLGVAIFASTVT